MQEGWLSWDQLFQSADEIHTPIKTQKDEVTNLGTVLAEKFPFCTLVSDT